MAPYHITFTDVVLKNAGMYPDRTAFVFGNESRTFGRYAQDVRQLASGLGALGVAGGDRIAILAVNCYEYFVLFGAAAWLGAVVVAVNWRLQPEEIRLVLEDCTPKVVVASPENVGVLKSLPDQCPFVVHRFGVGNGESGFDPLPVGTDPGPRSVPADESGDCPFVIIHTAAVEGRPRGAVLTQGNLLAAGLQTIVPMTIGPTDVYANLMPLFHVMGLEMAMAVFQAGGTNVIMSKFDAREAAKLIEQHKATVISAVPPMLSTILDEAQAAGYDLTSLRHVAGLFDRPDTIERCQRFTGARFWVGYGQTETAGYITLCPYDERPGSSGKEGPMVRMRVVDDHDRDVEPGLPGEVVMRGPTVFKGYRNLERDTEYTLRGGWHHTGDIGRVDEGYLYYLRRKPEKELIKTGGENVYPAEVETALMEHEDVGEACVFGVPDEHWGEAVKAVCVLRPGSALTERELIEFVGSKIARYKKPKFVTFMKELPKKTDGTIDREQLKG